MADLVLDEQYNYRGLTFGKDCDILVNSASGFHGFETRNSDLDQPRNDGSIRGQDYVNARTLGFKLSIWEPDIDGQLYEAYWEQVRETFRPSRSTDYPLTFKRPGQPEQFVKCRSIQLTRSEEWSTFNRLGYPPITLRAVDPRIYSTELRSQNIPLYAATGGGVDYPVTEFPVDFPAATQVEAVITNDGNDNAFPLLRFYGPISGTCTAVLVTNATTGQVFQVTTPLLANQILTGDMDAAATSSDRLVISLDGSTRYGSWALPREPFALAPGDNNLRFQITGSSTNAMCNVTWRSTWMD